MRATYITEDTAILSSLARERYAKWHSETVEQALLMHDAVSECAVVGQPCEERGTIVAAYVVLKQPMLAGPEMVRELQDFVKLTIAPYKYPRAVHFTDALPKTQTGKIQRFRLR